MNKEMLLKYSLIITDNLVIHTDKKSIEDLENDTGETINIEHGKIYYVNSYDENHKCKQIGIRIEDIKAITTNIGGK